MVICALLPRFALTVAAGGRTALAAGPVALAPEPGREAVIGEVSAAAEAFGVRAGLRLGEALARCPALRLVAPDPAGVGDEWDRLIGALENIGAAPSRFAALAAASRARARRAELAPEGPARLAAYLAPLPVSLLADRAETARLPEPLERFGIHTLGELARLPRAALADRFGAAGPLARDLARGRDTPLVARRAAERLEETLELPESGSGEQLEHALGLLIDRVLAHRERRGRSFRAVVVSATLVEGGTWRMRMTFREALADRRRMRLALAPRLAELPAPADVLRLRIEGFGPPEGHQRSLLSEPAAIRSARLREAVRQARAVAGPDAALHIVGVDPDSRVPERRHTLAPWDP